MTTVDITTTLNKTFREHRRYSEDGLPSAPSGAPLPVGDPSSGVHNPAKSDIRGAFTDVQTALQTGIDAAELAADEAQAAQAETEAEAASAISLISGLVNDIVSASNVPIFSTRAGIELLTIPAGLSAIRSNGYTTVGVGAALYKRAASEPTHAGKVRSADRFLPNGTADATNGGWWELEEDHPTPFMFGMVADNSTDDADAFENWGGYCGIRKRRGYLPEARCAFGRKIVWTKQFSTTCDTTGFLRWTNPASCGIELDWRANPHILFRMEFPSLLSPAIAADHTIPGYSEAEGWTYDVDSRVGDALYIRGGNRYSIYVHVAQGWVSCFHPTGSFDGTYGGVVSANIELVANTVDFCERFVHLDSGPAGSPGLAAFRVYANTAWCKHIVYVDGTASLVGGGGYVEIGGQAFVNEEGGCAVYTTGSPNGFKVDIRWLAAGKSIDSPAGTPSGLVVPYLAGDGASNGLTTDGNLSLGYCKAYRCEFNFGCAMGVPLNVVPKIGGEAVAGDPIRIKDAGSFNKITVSYQDQTVADATALSTTGTEAAFGATDAGRVAGVGAASLAKRIFCKAVVPDLPNFNAATFYFFSQLLSEEQERPIRVHSIDGGIQNRHLSVYARDDAVNVNRRGTVTFANLSGATITGATYYFWVIIDND